MSLFNKVLGIPEKQDNTKPVTPVIENRPGPVFAYRGQESHGVDPLPATPDDADELNRDVPVVVDPEPKIPEPIPVVIVDDENRRHEIKDWRVISTAANGAPTVVFNRQRNRTRLTIRNTSQDKTVLVGPDSSVSTMFGFPILPGASLDLSSTEEVWAVSADGNPVALVGLIEFATDL